MSYIYHLKPRPFEGTSLIPLNMMNKEGDLYKNHARKYEGREYLMEEIIPSLNCKWNDVVQFSALDPQKIVDKLKTIQTDLEMFRSEYFKIHVSQIVQIYDAVIYERNKKRVKKDFTIEDNEIIKFSHLYKETLQVPEETIDFWNRVRNNGGKYLWFPFVPHILIKGVIDTKNFEVCELKL